MVDIRSDNVNKPELKDRLCMFKLHVLILLILINPECRDTLGMLKYSTEFASGLMVLNEPRTRRQVTSVGIVYAKCINCKYS
jgi:hypothetical protein